jgi:hypothetical protein
VTDLVDPDLEHLLVIGISDMLTSRGEPAAVATRRKAGRAVKVTLTGGAGRTDEVQSTLQITLETFDATETGAWRLINLCGAYLFGLRYSTLGHTVVYDVRPFGGPANFPAREPDQSRYTRTFDLRVRLLPL